MKIWKSKYILDYIEKSDKYDLSIWDRSNTTLVIGGFMMTALKKGTRIKGLSINLLTNAKHFEVETK